MQTSLHNHIAELLVEKLDSRVQAVVQVSIRYCDRGGLEVFFIAFDSNPYIAYSFPDRMKHLQIFIFASYNSVPYSYQYAQFYHKNRIYVSVLFA